MYANAQARRVTGRHPAIAASMVTTVNVMNEESARSPSELTPATPLRTQTRATRAQNGMSSSHGLVLRRQLNHKSKRLRSPPCTKGSLNGDDRICAEGAPGAPPSKATHQLSCETTVLHRRRGRTGAGTAKQCSEPTGHVATRRSDSTPAETS